MNWRLDSNRGDDYMKPGAFSSPRARVAVEEAELWDEIKWIG